MPNSKIWHLYVITNVINGKKYVGITSDVVKRKSRHLTGNGSPLVAASINKYGKKNLHFEVCLSGSFNFISAAEVGWIAALNTVTPYGYNLIQGGEVLSKHSETSKRKMSEIAKKRYQRDGGRTRPPEERERIRQSLMGHQVSEITRQRQSKAASHSGRRILCRSL